jgi:hypothetical protein
MIGCLLPEYTVIFIYCVSGQLAAFIELVLEKLFPINHRRPTLGLCLRPQ